MPKVGMPDMKVNISRLVAPYLMPESKSTIKNDS